MSWLTFPPLSIYLTDVGENNLKLGTKNSSVFANNVELGVGKGGHNQGKTEDQNTCA